MTNYDYLAECERHYERKLERREEELRELIEQWRTKPEFDYPTDPRECADELEELLND